MKQIPVTRYFQALERLVSGCPEIVSKGTAINNNSVALEAGAKKGSIRKSRREHQALITEINEASEAQKNDVRSPKSKSSTAMRELERRLLVLAELAESYRVERDEGVAREVSLIREVNELKLQLENIRAGKVTVLHSAKT